jgi:hypothetical protein
MKEESSACGVGKMYVEREVEKVLKGIIIGGKGGRGGGVEEGGDGVRKEQETKGGGGEGGCKRMDRMVD